MSRKCVNIDENCDASPTGEAVNNCKRGEHLLVRGHSSNENIGAQNHENITGVVESEAIANPTHHRADLENESMGVIESHDGLSSLATAAATTATAGEQSTRSDTTAQASGGMPRVQRYHFSPSSGRRCVHHSEDTRPPQIDHGLPDDEIDSDDEDEFTFVEVPTIPTREVEVYQFFDVFHEHVEPQQVVDSAPDLSVDQPDAATDDTNFQSANETTRVENVEFEPMPINEEQETSMSSAQVLQRPQTANEDNDSMTTFSQSSFMTADDRSIENDHLMQTNISNLLATASNALNHELSAYYLAESNTPENAVSDSEISRAPGDIDPHDVLVSQNNSMNKNPKDDDPFRTTTESNAISEHDSTHANDAKDNRDNTEQVNSSSPRGSDRKENDEAFQRAANDFDSVAIHENLSPVIAERERTEEEADQLLEDIIKDRRDKTMGPNACSGVPQSGDDNIVTLAGSEANELLTPTEQTCRPDDSVKPSFNSTDRHYVDQVEWNIQGNNIQCGYFPVEMSANSQQLDSCEADIKEKHEASDVCNDTTVKKHNNCETVNVSVIPGNNDVIHDQLNGTFSVNGCYTEDSERPKLSSKYLIPETSLESSTVHSYCKTADCGAEIPKGEYVDVSTETSIIESYCGVKKDHAKDESCKELCQSACDIISNYSCNTDRTDFKNLFTEDVTTNQFKDEEQIENVISNMRDGDGVLSKEQGEFAEKEKDNKIKECILLSDVTENNCASDQYVQKAYAHITGLETDQDMANDVSEVSTQGRVFTDKSNTMPENHYTFDECDKKPACKLKDKTKLSPIHECSFVIKDTQDAADQDGDDHLQKNVQSEWTYPTQVDKVVNETTVFEEDSILLQNSTAQNIESVVPDSPIVSCVKGIVSSCLENAETCSQSMGLAPRPPTENPRSKCENRSKQALRRMKNIQSSKEGSSLSEQSHVKDTEGEAITDKSSDDENEERGEDDAVIRQSNTPDGLSQSISRSRSPSPYSPERLSTGPSLTSQSDDDSKKSSRSTTVSPNRSERSNTSIPQSPVNNDKDEEHGIYTNRATVAVDSGIDDSLQTSVNPKRNKEPSATNVDSGIVANVPQVKHNNNKAKVNDNNADTTQHGSKSLKPLQKRSNAKRTTADTLRASVDKLISSVNNSRSRPPKHTTRVKNSQDLSLPLLAPKPPQGSSRTRAIHEPLLKKRHRLARQHLESCDTKIEQNSSRSSSTDPTTKARGDCPVQPGLEATAQPGEGTGAQKHSKRSRMTDTDHLSPQYQRPKEKHAGPKLKTIKPHRPVNVKRMTVEEFDRYRSDRQMEQALAKIRRTKAVVDCHRNPNLADRNYRLNKRYREKVAENSQIAMENLRFVDLLREQKSSYARDTQLKDFKNNYKSMLKLGRHPDSWDTPKGLEDLQGTSRKTYGGYPNSHDRRRESQSPLLSSARSFRH